MSHPTPAAPRSRPSDPHPYRRGPLLPMTLAAACALVVGTAGCGGTAAPATPAAASGTSAVSSAAAPSSPPVGQAACDAGLTVTATALSYPGTGPVDAAPSGEALAAWADRMQAPLAGFRALAPAELGPDIDTLAAARQQAAGGQPLDLSDPALGAASTAVDQWMWDACGFPRLAATNSPTGLAGVPDTLPPGPISVSFENADGGTGFVLLLARVHDDVTLTVDDLIANRVDLAAQATIVMAASPGPDGQPARSSTRLTPGRYAVVSPQGAPPEFAGYHAAVITVA